MFHALVRRILEPTLFHCNNIHIQRRGASDKHIINNCQSFTDKISQFISLLLSDFREYLEVERICCNNL